jgi:hypothetical protein
VNTTYRLVRLLSLPKVGEIGPVKLYPERFLLNIKTQWPTFEVRLHKIQPLYQWRSSWSPINRLEIMLWTLPNLWVLWMITWPLFELYILFLIIIQWPATPQIRWPNFGKWWIKPIILFETPFIP